jgi:transposase
LSIKSIVRVLGVSRNTVRAALVSDAPPKYVRAPKGSFVDAVEPRIRELLAVYPRMPATVIAERIGWRRSIQALSARVVKLRPVYLPPNPGPILSAPRTSGARPASPCCLGCRLVLAARRWTRDRS